MLFLLLQIGKDRYALDTAVIREVLPMLQLKEMPRAEKGVAGAFDYRGMAAPAIDLCALALGRAAAGRLSTRIVVADYAYADGQTGGLGLIAEGATETARFAAADFSEFGVATGLAPYLGPIARDPRGLIQRIEVEHVLSPSLRQLLFAAPIAAP